MSSPLFLRCCLALLMACALGAPFPARAAVDKALQVKLETAYAGWRTALTQQDSALWLKRTARYRQMLLRNQIVSQRMPWPRAVFTLALQPPPVSGLKLLDATAVGDTARLAYFGKVDFNIPGEAAHENALVLWFLKEGEEWKFNWVQYVNLNNPEAKKKAAGGDASFLQNEDFAMNGKYPEVPKPCENPYHVAWLHIESIGYKTSVNINNLSEEVVDQSAATRVVIGGLRKGPNTIVIKPEIAERDAAKRSLEVVLVIPSGNPAKPETEMLRWKIEPGKEEASYQKTVWGPSKVAVGG